ncbi:MAG TPA: hypothetical protein VFT15_17370 [Chitinophagaceae bacterium]|nr:hypothetical protein [Chitinophagaceae bacterium]
MVPYTVVKKQVEILLDLIEQKRRDNLVKTNFGLTGIWLPLPLPNSR